MRTLRQVLTRSCTSLLDMIVGFGLVSAPATFRENGRGGDAFGGLPRRVLKEDLVVTFRRTSFKDQVVGSSVDDDSGDDSGDETGSVASVAGVDGVLGADFCGWCLSEESSYRDVMSPPPSQEKARPRR